MILLSLFIGTLPWIDNWAHFGGFLFGMPAAVIFLPFITFGKWDRRRKLLLLAIAVPFLVILFVGMCKRDPIRYFSPVPCYTYSPS